MDALSFHVNQGDASIDVFEGSSGLFGRAKALTRNLILIAMKQGNKGEPAILIASECSVLYHTDVWI